MTDSNRSQDPNTLPTSGEVRKHGETSPLGMPKVVGPYHILSVLGEGGFGIVYLAERREPFFQRVALKVLKPGMDSAAILSRFEQERQTLALLDHPCITHILDAGVTDRGLPYFVMELVQGPKITDYCAQRRLGLEERLEIFSAVCEGVQHAHQKGIIHRDLKPSNILITTQDNKPQPKIIDFGIAKATMPGPAMRSMVTLAGQVIGTPAYMSPEQAGSTELDLDTRTDIYSLGVLLYELLTGTLPYEEHTLQGAAIGEIQRLIREVDPPRPSSRVAKQLRGETATGTTIGTHETRRLFRELKGDLDWIIMKAIEKDRRRRYESAGALADDLTRYLKNETISAGPPSTMYRLTKFVRRNRLPVAAGTAIMLALVGGLISSLMLYQKAREMRRQAEENYAESNTAFTFIDEMFGTVDPANARGKEVTVIELLDSSSKQSETLLKASPGAEALVRGAFGRAYNQLGRTTEAETQYKKAYELAAKAWGEDRPDTITAKVGLALAQLNLGRLEDALKLLEDARDRRIKVLGAKHPDTIQVLDFASVVLSRLNRYDEALPISREVLAFREKELGMDHPDTLSTTNGLSDLLQQMGKLTEAEQISASAAARADKAKALGPDSPIALEAHSIHASQLLAMGKHEDAAKELERLSKVQERVLGPDHNSTLTTMDILQKALLKTGDAARSEAIAREVADRCSKTLGAENPRTLTYLNNLALTLHKLKKFDDEKKILEPLMSTAERVLGPENDQTFSIRNSYALLLLDTGHPDQCVPIFREVVKGLSKTLSPDHWKVGAARGYLADSLAESGNAAEAATEYQTGYGILEKVLTASHDRSKSLASSAAKHLEGKVPAAELDTWKKRAEAK